MNSEYKTPIQTLRYLPALLYLPGTTHFYESVIKRAVSTIFTPLVWRGRRIRTRDPASKANDLPTELSKRSITWNSPGENLYVWYRIWQCMMTLLAMVRYLSFFNSHSTTMNLMRTVQRWPLKFIKPVARHYLLQVQRAVLWSLSKTHSS